MHEYKPIELGDRAIFEDFFSLDPPRISELTFTNLFMWRYRYRHVWRVWQDCLLVIFRPEGEPTFGLQPVGHGNKRKALAEICRDLQKVSSEVRVCRVDKDFVQEHVDDQRYEIIEDRDNSDYVYLADNLIKLPGNRYHRKKNHLNRFLKNYRFRYRVLNAELIQLFLSLQEAWCELRECDQNPGLFQENIAIHEALTHHQELGFKGGAIIIDSKVEAFALGEKLNSDTAVIHIEKANPDIPGVYAAINQAFCAEEWSQIKYINREQDLGMEGLRQAKLSYNPNHMVEKFTVVPKS
jgi:hypothetical protein